MEASTRQHTVEPERVAELQAQVDVLQQKLHLLHATDASTLRRSYATVAQHVQALKLEAARLEELVNELEPELYPPEYIAEELGKAAVVSGGVFVIFKVVKTITPLPVRLSSWLRSGIAAVTAIVVTWRFARSSISRFAASLLDHKRRRKAVLREMAELQQRVDILHALTTSTPQALQQQQQQLVVGQQVGSSTAAAAAAGGGAFAAAAGEASSAQQQQMQQQQRGEQFVVVGMPRVESGGFALQSPTVSSPAPELAAAQQAAAAFAAASTAAAGAAAVAAVDSKAVAAAVQQQMVGTAAVAARSAAAAVGASLQQAFTSSSSSSTTSAPQQLQHQRRSLSEQESVASAGSSSTRSSLEQRQPSRTSAFAIPLPSMIMSGWGGMVMQQEQRAHTQAGTPPPAAAADSAGLSAAAAADAAADAAGTSAAAADRQASTDSEGPGEWVEQPSCYDGAGGNGGSGGERVSPHSSSSEEGVLLERE